MSVKLTWSPRVAGDSQKIYRSTAPFNVDTLPSVLATVGALNTEYSDGSAADGTQYYYAVATVLGSRVALSELVAVTAAGEAAPAPPPTEDIPASVTHFVKPADMVFSGGILTGVVDRVAASSSYFTVGGSPVGDTTNGYEQVATVQANYGRLSSSLGARYLSMLIQRNGTADTASVIFATTNGNNFGAVGEVGSSSSTSANLTISKYRINGADVTSIDRDQFWTDLMDDTDPHVFGSDIIINQDLYLGRYIQSSAFSYNGYIKGWAMFTDWADADDVETALLF